MSKILSFNLSAKQLVDFALEKHRKGELISSARYARDAINANKRYIEAYGVLACLFSAENEFELANKTIFKGMHASKDYDNVNLRRQLAINYLHLEMPDVALYYTTEEQDADLIDALDNIMADIEEDEEAPDLYLSYPPTNEFYERQVALAYQHATEGDMQGALQLLATVPEDCELAIKTRLIFYTMSNDVDAAIEYGEKLVEKGCITTPVRCTLASAYLIKGRNEEAYEIAKPLLDKDNKDVESMFMVLPLAVSLNMHADVVRLIKNITSRPKFNSSKRLMIWYSQGLYNIGQRDIAKAVMSDVNTFYGEESPAFYYLDLYSQNPDTVEYSLSMPKGGNVRNMNTVRDILNMSNDELEAFDKTHKKVGDNLNYYVHWAFTNTGKTLHKALISKIVQCRRGLEILENNLISGELSYGLMGAIIDEITVLKDHSLPFEFDIVVQERFKHIVCPFPRAMDILPPVLKKAVHLCIVDIVFTDEDPNYYLKSFKKLIDEIVTVGEDGKPVFSTKSREKLGKVRSADTLVGVLLLKVYEEDETRESVIERYKLSPKLYDKYEKIVFGEDDGE